MEKVKLELDPVDAVNILGLFQYLMRDYKMHPRALDTINNYHRELHDNITSEQMDQVAAQIETDVMLDKLGIEQEYESQKHVHIKPSEDNNPFKIVGKVNGNAQEHLQTEFFDQLRFKTKEQAKEAGELYTVDYQYPLMIVTDPDGTVTHLRMMYAAPFGLDVQDTATLKSWLDNDMDKRANNDEI